MYRCARSAIRIGIDMAIMVRTLRNQNCTPRDSNEPEMNIGMVIAFLLLMTSENNSSFQVKAKIIKAVADKAGAQRGRAILEKVVK